MEREVGGGIGMGNTCKSMADSCQSMAKNHYKVKNNNNNNNKQTKKLLKKVIILDIWGFITDCKNPLSCNCGHQNDITAQTQSKDPDQ